MTSSLPQSILFYLTPTGILECFGRRGPRHHSTNVIHLSFEGQQFFSRYWKMPQTVRNHKLCYTAFPNSCNILLSAPIWLRKNNILISYRYIKKEVLVSTYNCSSWCFEVHWKIVPFAVLLQVKVWRRKINYCSEDSWKDPEAAPFLLFPMKIHWV